MIGDTTESSAVFANEEINGVLSMVESDVYEASALLLRRLAKDKALLAVYKKAGDYSEDNREIGKQLLALANKYEEKSQSVPAEQIATEVYTDFNYREIMRNKSLRNEDLNA